MAAHRNPPHAAADDDEAMTFTISECVENHPGMLKTGKIDPNEAFTPEDLRRIAVAYPGIAELNNLTNALHEDLRPYAEEAVVLVLRGFLTPDEAIAVFEEQKRYPWDGQALMYGKLVHKRARTNVCVAPVACEPDLANGQGTILAWSAVPLLDAVRERLAELTGRVCEYAEGNYYYDTKKCGIGYHGDTERCMVIGIRLGATIPLMYHWFHRFHAVNTEPVEIHLEAGDVYIMSGKAVGTDFKCSSQLTLRHAAGCPKYTNLKKKQMPLE